MSDVVDMADTFLALDFSPKRPVREHVFVPRDTTLLTTSTTKAVKNRRGDASDRLEVEDK